MKKKVILTGSLIVVEEGSASFITKALTGIGDIIEKYCKQEVNTCITSKNGIHNLRFELSQNDFIEFETIKRDVYVSDEDRFYCILRLKNISSLDPKSLVVKIMFDVFNWS
ncbi:MAG: hypothetical protein IJZ42_04530 [Lachnospiraceae bacterium]|nr:hypothetical protein [Lachnospiraceae bacterium]